MKTITKEWLKKKGACRDGVQWFLAQEETSTKSILLKLHKENRTGDALWVIHNTMNKKQSVQLAVFLARLCLEIFEKQAPEDDRPRKAIEAAEVYLKNPCYRTKTAARSASSAARSAAYSVARLAASAANSAAYSAYSAARSSARSAAYSASYSADSAARSARSAVQKSIIEKAIELLNL